ALQLPQDAVERGRCHQARRGAAPVAPRGRVARSAVLGKLAMLDQQTAGADEAGQLRIAEIEEAFPDVVINRLLPQLLAWAETGADARGRDARVEGRAVKGQLAAFAVAEDADGQLILLLKPIDRR